MLCRLGLLDERPVLELKGKFLVGRVVLGAMAQSFPLRANSCPSRRHREPQHGLTTCHAWTQGAPFESQSKAVLRPYNTIDTGEKNAGKMPALTKRECERFGGDAV